MLIVAIFSFSSLAFLIVFDFNTSRLNDFIDCRFKIIKRFYANKSLNETFYKIIALLFMNNLTLCD